MSVNRPVLKGEISQALQYQLAAGLIALLIALLGILAFALLFIYGAPFILTSLITAMFVGSTVFLSGILNGIVNDLIGCLECLPFYLLGHRFNQRAIIESNKPLAVGAASGITNTINTSLITAGAVITVTLVASFFVPIATFALPILFILIPIMAAAAQHYSKLKMKERLVDKTIYTDYSSLTDKPNQLTRIECDFNDAKINLDEYHLDRLSLMCTTEEEKNHWLGNLDKVKFNKIAVPLAGAFSLAGIVSLTAVSQFLPAILFTSIFATILPLAAVTLLAAVTICLVSYMIINHRKQDDNIYMLNFDNDKIVNIDIDESINSKYIWQNLNIKNASQIKAIPPVNNYKLEQAIPRISLITLQSNINIKNDIELGFVHHTTSPDSSPEIMSRA